MRTIIVVLLIVGLAGCLKPGPTVVSLNATAAAGMNPGPDGSDRPLTVAVYHLTTPVSFQSAPFAALQSDAAGTLGADLLQEDTLVLPPGGTAALDIAVADGATAVGLLAGFRDPAGKARQQVLPVASGRTSDVTLTVGPSGLVLN
ncbi:MAG: type VI secretion system lipoprotein TssJ [Paracoccaceae bacterium]|nr:type VI secretion system lipoprotein TssJ [Paracoccaceae bacterium]